MALDRQRVLRARECAPTETTRSHSTRPISRPVASPHAGRAARCARLRTPVPGCPSASRSNARPTRSARAYSGALPRTSTRTARSSHRPSPAAIVSPAWSAGESSRPIAAAMPPCAYSVLLSLGSAFVMMMMSPAGASSTAARSPAIPLPTIMKSPRTSTGLLSTTLAISMVLERRLTPNSCSALTSCRIASLPHLHRTWTDGAAGPAHRVVSTAGVARSSSSRARSSGSCTARRSRKRCRRPNRSCCPTAKSTSSSPPRRAPTNRSSSWTPIAARASSPSAAASSATWRDSSPRPICAASS